MYARIYHALPKVLCIQSTQLLKLLVTLFVLEDFGLAIVWGLGMAASSLTTEEVDWHQHMIVQCLQHTYIWMCVHICTYIRELHCFNLPLQWDFILLVWLNRAATAERAQYYTQIYVSEQ